MSLRKCFFLNFHCRPFFQAICHPLFTCLELVCTAPVLMLWMDTLCIFLAKLVCWFFANLSHSLLWHIILYFCLCCPVWARGRCRISPLCFLAQCCKRQLNQGSFFCCILGCLLFLICIEFVYLYFPVLFCLSVSIKWLAVKTAFEMTCIVSSGALNSTPTNQPRQSANQLNWLPNVRTYV